VAASAIGHRHPQARRLRDLLRDPAARRREGAFVLEGPRLVADALDRGAALEAVYLGQNAREAFAGLTARVDAAGVPVLDLREGVLEKVGSTRTPQPVLAVAPIPGAVELDALAPGRVVVTVGLQDPGNLGTVVRSAEASGATAVVVARATHGVDPWNPKVVRGSAGAVLGVPVIAVDDAVAALDRLRTRGWRLVGTDSGAPVAYTDTDLTGTVAIVIGSEAHGVPDDVVGSIELVVAIPMAGATESLNAGVAASVLLFEAARQARRMGSGPRGAGP
jgi:TrmH family RNA methyltransferase